MNSLSAPTCSSEYSEADGLNRNDPRSNVQFSGDISSLNHELMHTQTMSRLVYKGRDITSLAEGSIDQKKVMGHYDTLKVQDKKERSRSATLKLRRFNNWVKSCLIDKYLGDSECQALDLCGGKFGDLPKWRAACESKKLNYVVLADHSKVEVIEALSRYNTSIAAYEEYSRVLASKKPWPRGKAVPKKPPAADFVVADCCRTESRARALLINVSECLAPGGYFIGTLPDANVIMKIVRGQQSSRDPQTGDFGFSNEFMSLSFPGSGRLAQVPEYGGLALDLGSGGLAVLREFGVRYQFNLHDAIDRCDEFLVHFPTLVRLAGEYGPKPVLSQNFHSFYDDIMRRQDKASRDYQHMFKRNVQRQSDTNFPAALWAICNIYKVFAFQKVGDQSSVKRQKRFIDICEKKPYEIRE
eukprot:458171_1